jgi:hypothetical protein
MFKTIFKALFGLNICWGILFGMSALITTYKVNNDESYNCSTSYDQYAESDTYPEILGSKKLGFYTVFGFFNHSDTPRASYDSDFDCLHSEWGQTIVTFFLFSIWIASLIYSTKYNYLISITSLLSTVGILWAINYLS